MLFEQEVGPQPPKEITSPMEVQALLKALHTSRSPLQVHFDDRSQTYQTYIVAVDAEHSVFYMDELIPSIGDKWMAQGEPFHVDTWMDGVQIRWQHAGASRVELDDATPAFHLPLPEQLIYHQRRGAYRAPIYRSLDTRLELISQRNKGQLAGELLDLSITGCKLRLLGNHSQSLSPGERYEHSQLRLEDGIQFEVNAEIRYCQYQEEHDESHVGLHFHQPTIQAQRQLERFVNQLQREARRLAREDLF